MSLAPSWRVLFHYAPVLQVSADTNRTWHQMCVETSDASRAANNAHLIVRHGNLDLAKAPVDKTRTVWLKHAWISVAWLFWQTGPQLRRLQQKKKKKEEEKEKEKDKAKENKKRESKNRRKKNTTNNNQKKKMTNKKTKTTMNAYEAFAIWGWMGTICMLLGAYFRVVGYLDLDP